MVQPRLLVFCVPCPRRKKIPSRNESLDGNQALPKDNWPVAEENSSFFHSLKFWWKKVPFTTILHSNWWKSSRANGSNWKAPGNNHVSAISTEIFKYVRIHPNFTSRTVWCEKIFLSCFPKTTEKRQAQQSTPTSIENFNRNATYVIVAWSHSIYISINHKNLKEKRSVLWEYINQNVSINAPGAMSLIQVIFPLSSLCQESASGDWLFGIMFHVCCRKQIQQRDAGDVLCQDSSKSI